MAIEFVCGNCSKTLRVPEEHLGKKARCPNCSWINVVEPQRPSQHTSPYQPVRETIPPYQPQSSTPRGVESAIDFSKPTIDYPYTPTMGTGYQSTHLAPHRGGLVLTLGILSLFVNCFFIPGILAWSFGRSDLNQMKAGRMNREGESMTQVGMILGIVGTFLPLVAFAFWILILIVTVAAG